MADRYWVGGSGSWNSTTKWSATSGGASGASVPTSVDNAIFDINSGTAHFTVTVSSGSTCANLTITPENVTGVTTFSINSGFVVSGTFSTSGTLGNRRIRFASDTASLMRDVSIASIGSVSDVDFRGIRIIGAGGTLSGTRIGNLGINENINFSTPKTVYWSNTAGGNWSATSWATSSGGTASTDNHPLAQDTAIIENTGLNASTTITLDSAISYFGTIDMSTRTTAMVLAGSTTYTVYKDWKFGSGVTRTYSGTLVFSGQDTQTIISAGKSFGGNLTVERYSSVGSLTLNDALNIGTFTLTVSAGTFDTNNYNVTAAALANTTTNIKEIRLGSSTLTLSSGTQPISLNSVSSNTTFNAGTSQINLTGTSSLTLGGAGHSFYNVSFTGTSPITHNITGENSFNNLTITSPGPAGMIQITFNSNQTITGTLNCSSNAPIYRIFIRSDVLGTTRTLTVNTLDGTNCDFRDIIIAGTATGSSQTGAGDCGGNSGITFPTAKTVYWNLSGNQNWSSLAWASSSGGAPAVSNFPLAQDTVIFNEAAGSVTGIITIETSWNIGTFDASARTTAMTLTIGTNLPFVYGDWKFGSGITSSSTTGTITFSKRGTQTITSNGVTFGCAVTINSITGTVQLADALILDSARALTLTSGTFNAVTYNVTCGVFSSNVNTTRTLRMGSGTWTLSGTATIWNTTVTTGLAFYKGTANILTSNTSTSARTFNGGNLSYNKLTIGGTTGISTFTINDSNTFTELASTKTVAHTIALGATTQTFGKWTITGTAGNIVSLTGSSANHILLEATSGIDYLSMSSVGFSSSSLGEFFCGNNTSGTASAPVYRQVRPAAQTLYATPLTSSRNWSLGEFSTTSGGLPINRAPYSFDNVVLDANSSNAFGGGSYTLTIDATARCKSLTISGPSSGTVTLAGASALIVHDNLTLPATGLTRTYTGNITLSGSTGVKTLTTNGVALASFITINGINCEWTLGSSLTSTNGSIIVTNGTFNSSTYNITTGSISSDNMNTRTITFGSGTITLTDTNAINFGLSESNRANLVFNAGTSQINCSFANTSFTGNNQTFYNVNFTSTSVGAILIYGVNSFNNLSFTGITANGLKIIGFTADQTITGTFTCSAGTNASMRHFVRSNTLGTTRTLTCAAVSLTDVDFRDITVAGAAVPATGTRIGDCKGNSGITFTTAANKYWNLLGGGTWSTSGWATTSGGSTSANNFPLAQDTCFFESTGLISGGNVTIDAAYNIGTINMSARTTNLMTLATGSISPTVYGNWINGTGTTLTGTNSISFSGRGAQTITSAGKTFSQTFNISSPGGSVTLLDALTLNSSSTELTLSNGIFDAASYNVTLSGSTGGFSSTGSSTRTLAIGSGTWTIAASSLAWTTFTTTNLTITGTGTLKFTSGTSKSFVGNNNVPSSSNALYSGITIDQAGAGTLSISGYNSFANITNTRNTVGASTITFDAGTTQKLANFTATGVSGRILSLASTTLTSPVNFILTSSIKPDVNFLSINSIIAYPLSTTWYANTSSASIGSLGFLFQAKPVPSQNSSQFLLTFS